MDAALIDTSLIGLGLTIFVTIIGSVVWFVRLEGQVKTQKELSVLQDKYFDERHAEQIARFNRTDEKIDTLTEKIDRAIEHIHHA